MAQKTRPQTGFEQRLHIALDLSPEEKEEYNKLLARYFCCLGLQTQIS